MYKMKLDTNANRLAFNRMDPISAATNTFKPRAFRILWKEKKGKAPFIFAWIHT